MFLVISVVALAAMLGLLVYDPDRFEHCHFRRQLRPVELFIGGSGALAVATTKFISVPFIPHVVPAIGGLLMMLWLATMLKPNAATVTGLFGGLANCLVVNVNGGWMPVLGLADQDATHTPLTDSTLLPWLGDIFTSGSGNFAISFSAGDLLMTAGCILSVFILVRRR